MASLIQTLDASILTLRTVFLAIAAGLGGLCAVEWAVRTRRMHPFSAIARTSRRILAPVMKPVERSVVRAGGNPASAPWWTLLALIVCGIVVLQTLDFVRYQVAAVSTAVGLGPRGVLRVLVRWTFGAFYIALVIRVVVSWIGVGEFNRFVRWTHTVTEPVLAPLRRLLPVIGMVDLSPLVAYFVLRVIESLLLAWL